MYDRTRHAMQPLLALEFPVPIGPAGAQNMPGRGEPGPAGFVAAANEDIEGQENGMMKKLTEPQGFAGQDTTDAGRIGDYLYVRHTYASDELENLGIDHVFCKEVLPIPPAASDEEVSRFVDTVSLFERLDIEEDGALGGSAGGCCSVAKGSHRPENRCAGRTARDGTVGNPARNDGYATVIRRTWLFFTHVGQTRFFGVRTGDDLAYHTFDRNWISGFWEHSDCFCVLFFRDFGLWHLRHGDIIPEKIKLFYTAGLYRDGACIALLLFDHLPVF